MCNATAIIKHLTTTKRVTTPGVWNIIARKLAKIVNKCNVSHNSLQKKLWNSLIFN